VVIPERTERKYVPYPEYKDSGVEWLEQIPTHWEIKRLKRISSVKFSGVDKHSKEDEEPVRLCNYTDVYNSNTILPNRDFMEATATKNEIAMFSLKRDDVLITKDSEDWRDIAVPSYVSTNLPGVICGYHLALIRSNSSIINGKYLFWAFCAHNINHQFTIASTGITRFGLGKYWLDNSLFFIPPFEEQQTIADFLDLETSSIDELITRKQRLIDLLQEQRTALITHTVTKGLNMDVPMKDNGVEWLGEIPAYWDIKRLRFLTKVNPSRTMTKGLPSDLEVSFLPMEDVGCGILNMEQTQELASVSEGYTYFRDGDVLVAKITPCFENGKGAIAEGLINGIGFGTTELHVIHPTPNLSRRFLLYITISHSFRKVGESQMYGAAGQKRVPDRFIRDFMCPYPSLQEQQAIADFLDSETTRIDSLVDRINRAVEKLQEYRSALITAAVTGKIDVRAHVT